MIIRIVNMILSVLIVVVVVVVNATTAPDVDVDVLWLLPNSKTDERFSHTKKNAMYHVSHT